jgi:predicted esterase
VDEGSVQKKMYEVAHAVTEQEMQDIIEFMVSKIQN